MGGKSSYLQIRALALIPRSNVGFRQVLARAVPESNGKLPEVCPSKPQIPVHTITLNADRVCYLPNVLCLSGPRGLARRSSGAESLASGDDLHLLLDDTRIRLFGTLGVERKRLGIQMGCTGVSNCGL